MFEGKLGSLGGLLAAAVLGASLPAYAEPLLHNLQPHAESRGAANPAVARYVTSVGRRSFIFDQEAMAPDALFRLDGDDEVWVLEPSPLPGRGTIYRNDAGERVLQVTSLGGLTLYVGTPEGVPASIQGDAEQLLLPPTIPDRIMVERTTQASYRTNRAAQAAVGHETEVTFEPDNYTPATSPVFLDAITITADALVSLGHRKDAKSAKEAKAFLSKLEKVQFIVGAKPDVSFNGSVLTITLRPGKGYAGRPSSSRIIKAALRH
jgi:hypothetical protein